MFKGRLRAAFFDFHERGAETRCTFPPNCLTRDLAHFLRSMRAGARPLRADKSMI